MAQSASSAESSGGAPIRCLEFFSGIGGMHYAMQEASVNYKVIAAFDINRVANACYEYNFGLTPTVVNIEHLSVEHYDKLQADCWLMSPPCQPFTRGGKMMDHEDARSTGLLYLISILDKLKSPPKYIFLENVLNFEVSQCHAALIEKLSQMGYEMEEYLVSPCDAWINIPNGRLRYYLGAVRTSSEPVPHDGHIIRSFSEVLGPSPISTADAPLIQHYLRPEGDSEIYKVPERYIWDYKNYRHDIASPKGRRSTTFTKSYGSKYIIGTGSFLQTKHFDLTYEPDDQNVLITLGLRFFTPSEIALLHGFPLDEGATDNGQDKRKVLFKFPPSTSLAPRYRLLGNSLNVKVVALVLNRLFKK